MSNGAHQGAVERGSLFTQTGSTLVTAGNDGTIRQWDAAQRPSDPGDQRWPVLRICWRSRLTEQQLPRRPIVRREAPAFRVWDLTEWPAAA